MAGGKALTCKWVLQTSLWFSVALSLWYFINSQCPLVALCRLLVTPQRLLVAHQRSL